MRPVSVQVFSMEVLRLSFSASSSSRRSAGAAGEVLGACEAPSAELIVICNGHLVGGERLKL